MDPRTMEAAQGTWEQIRQWIQMVPQQAKGSPDQLDEWQAEAIKWLSTGKNVIVDAPTTAGKTRIVENFFQANLGRPQFRAAYTTPVKSLSNDKFREFCDLFGRDNVGLATGDVKDNLGAPIVVSTLECYRNSLLGIEPDLGRSLVVFDEYHYLQDKSRGSAWEESLILTPASCQLLLLSATVANPEDFADWLISLGHKDTKLIRTTKRPVPLKNLFFTQGAWILDEKIKPPRPHLPKEGSLPKSLPIEDLVRRIPVLEQMNLTPCLIYYGNRLSCELMAIALKHNIPPLPADQRKAVENELQQLNEQLSSHRFFTKELMNLVSVYGIAYHHSGLTPVVRMVIEALLKKGLLRYCVATMGLSLGVNFSVRSCLVADYERPSDGGPVKYNDEEILQMTGRAGRRGRDSYGFSLWPTLASYHLFSDAQRPVVSSNLKIEPTTFLNLIGKGYDIARCEEFYAKSFMSFQSSRDNLFVIDQSKLHGALRGPKQKRKEASNPLHALYVHLHKIECLTPSDQLTELGSLARYFPQSGGLVIAKLFCTNTFHERNLLDCLQLMAAFHLPRHKKPRVHRDYTFPLDMDEMEFLAEKYYPEHLFPNLYDPPYGRRQHAVLREFNPAAGYLVKEWAEGKSWRELVSEIITDRFNEGDLINLLYRAATYLQSLAQARLIHISPLAHTIWRTMMRDPLGIEKRTTEVEDGLPSS
jgi:superfamily II RNA helicase